MIVKYYWKTAGGYYIDRQHAGMIAAAAGSKIEQCIHIGSHPIENIIWFNDYLNKLKNEVIKEKMFELLAPKSKLPVQEVTKFWHAVLENLKNIPQEKALAGIRSYQNTMKFFDDTYNEYNALDIVYNSEPETVAETIIRWHLVKQ